MGPVGFLEEEAELELEGEDWKRWVGTRRMKGSKAAPREAPSCPHRQSAYFSDLSEISYLKATFLLFTGRSSSCREQ